MTTLQDALMLTGGGIISLVGAGGKTSLMVALASELARDGDTVLATTTTKIKAPPDGQSSAVVVSKDIRTVVDQSRAALSRAPIVTAAAGTEGSSGKLVGFPPAAIEVIGQSGLFRWLIVEADGAARRPLKVPAAHEPVIPTASRWVVGMIGLSAMGNPVSDQWVFRLDHFCRITGLVPGDTIDAKAVAACLVHPTGVMRGAPVSARQIVFLNQADDDLAQASAQAVLNILERSPGRLDRAVIGSMHPRPIIVDLRDLKPR